MNAEESANVKISDLWMEFFHNRPLRIIAFFFITAFAMMSIGNAAGAYFMNSNLHGTSEQLSIFMGLGSAPSFIFMPLVPMIEGNRQEEHVLCVPGHRHRGYGIPLSGSKDGAAKYDARLYRPVC